MRTLDAGVDNLKLNSVAFLDGELKLPLVTAEAPREDLDLISLTFTGGTLRNVSITYTNWTPEPLDISAVTFLDGTLT